MKKFFLILIAVLLPAASAVAENTLHLGAYFPLSFLSVDNSSVNLKGAGASFDFTHVAERGFTWKAGAGADVITNDDIFTYDNGKCRGVDLNLEFGFGYSFLHDEELTLSLLGTFGLRGQSAIRECDYYDSVLGVKFASTESSYSNALFFIGPEFSLTYRLTRHLGIFGNFGLFLATGSSDLEIKIVGPADTEYNGKNSDENLSSTGLILQPKLGFSLTF